jgi:hypothetical protein
MSVRPFDAVQIYSQGKARFGSNSALLVDAQRNRFTLRSSLQRITS